MFFLFVLQKGRRRRNNRMNNKLPPLKCSNTFMSQYFNPVTLCIFMRSSN